VGTHDSGWSVSRGLLEVGVEMTAKTVVWRHEGSVVLVVLEVWGSQWLCGEIWWHVVGEGWLLVNCVENGGKGHAWLWEVVAGRLWSMALGLEVQGRVTHGFF